MTVDRHPYRRQHVELVDDDRGRIILREMDRVLQFITPIILALPSASIGVASANASYVTLSHTADLSAERVLTGTADQIVVTDNGPDSTVVLSTPLVGHPYVTIGNVAGLTGERALTGTTNQITVTDNGANSSVVLSTPQNLHTATIFQVAQLGIGAAASSSPAMALDVTGSSRWVSSDVAIAVGQNNLNVGSATIVRLTTGGGAGGSTLSGITNGISGRVLILINVTGGPLSILHNVTSTAANRFNNPGAVALLLSDGDRIIVTYDATTSRWRTGKQGATWANAAETITNNWTWQANLLIDITNSGTFQIDSDTGSVGQPYIDFLDSVAGNSLRLQTLSVTGTRTLSLPDATDTLVGKATTDNLSNKTFITLTTFDATGGNTGQARLKGDSAGTLPFLQFFSLTGSSTLNLVPATLSGSTTLSLPNATDTVVARSTTDTLANKTLGITCHLNSDTILSGVHFQDVTDTTKTFRVILSGSATGTRSALSFANSTASTYTAMANLSGNLVLVGDDPPAVAAGSLGKVDLTAQTANIGTTNLSSTPPAGFYEVDVILMCTTSAVGAGTLAVVIGWTDDVGATTSTVITAFALTGTGRTTGIARLRLASGDITYAVTITGIYSTAQYAVYVRTVALG